MSSDERDSDDQKAPYPATIGDKIVAGIALGTFVEIASWCVIGVLWLAFSGGVLGAMAAIIIGWCVVVVWREFARRSEKPIQSPPPSNE